MHFKYAKTIEFIRERLMLAGIPTGMLVIVRDTIEVDVYEMRRELSLEQRKQIDTRLAQMSDIHETANSAVRVFSNAR